MDVPGSIVDEGGAWRHLPSGARFLQRWEDFRAEVCIRYDEVGSDVSVRYAGRHGRVSLYVYPVPSGGIGAALDTACAEMMAATPGASGLATHDVWLAPSGGAMLAGRTSRALGAGLDESPSWLELFQQGAWLVKLRARCARRRVARVEAFFDAWLDASGFLDSPSAKA